MKVTVKEQAEQKLQLPILMQDKNKNIVVYIFEELDEEWEGKITTLKGLVLSAKHAYIKHSEGEIAYFKPSDLVEFVGKITIGQISVQKHTITQAICLEKLNYRLN